MTAKNPRKKSNSSQISILTVTGLDQIGIIAKISTAMTKSAINIIDVNQKIMEEHFVMTMACDMTNTTASMKQVQASLSKIADKMDLRITFQHEDLFKAMHRV
jgi:ACT domain-containing protein